MPAVEPRQAATSPAVVVVGGGPVGMGLALELGRRGVRCVVIERHPSPQPIPKGQNLTQRTMEHFRSWGVEAAVRRARLLPASFPAGGVVAYGTLLSGHWYPWYRRADVGRYYFAANDRLPQYRTEAVLRAAVARLRSVEVHLGWDAQQIEVDGGGVRVTAVRSGGGAPAPPLVVSGDYVVGCDGAASVVARQAGIDERRSDHDRVMALVVFTSGELDKLVAATFPPTAFFNVLHPDFDGYWQFFGRVDPRGQWFFHAPVLGERPRDGVDVGWMLERAAGRPISVDVDHVGFWDLRVAVAARYQAGRAFVAGDAAHSHPPYGAFGINAGLEDARNLGWKLAATIQGWGGDQLLASYDRERRPVFESTARDFIESMVAADREFVRRYAPEVDRAAFEHAWRERAAGAGASVRTFAPHYEGSPIVAGPDGASPSARGTHSFEAIAGHHLPPQPLSSGRPLIDRLGTGFTLLAFGAEPEVVRAMERAASDLSVPLAVVSDTRAGGRERYGVPLVLVRPDHFVAWAGNGPVDDPHALLARACGGAPAPP